MAIAACVQMEMYIFHLYQKKLMDSIQELLLKIYGLITQIHKYKRKHSYDDNNGVCYHINIKLDRCTNFSKYGVPDKVSYNDNIYCLTLEKNYIMLVRHNGIIGWCGNCFRDYVAVLMEHEKKFLIIGNKNAIIYKEFFPLLKDNEVWIGCTNVKEFLQPDGSIKKFGNIGRFTNLDIAKRHEKLILWKDYTLEEYPKFDNYEGINVDKVSKILCDYDGIIGVPITFLDSYCPEQFEIVGISMANNSLMTKHYGDYIRYKQNGEKQDVQV